MKNGSRCSICSGRYKYSIDNVREITKQRGFELLSNEYKNSKEKLSFKCRKGHVFYTSFSQILKGVNCNVCSGKCKYNINNVRQIFESEGYKLLENEYKTSNTKMKVVCPNGHIIYIQLCRFLEGHRCRECYLEYNRGANHPMWKSGKSGTIQYFRQYIESWRRDSIKYCGYKCVLTGSKEFDVHHLINFVDILNKTISDLNLELHEDISKYSDEEIQKIYDKLLENHYSIGYGVCLRKDLHILFHKLYGKENNTPAQFKEFKEKYKNGELDKYLQKEAVNA